ncbi:MAG TPA: cyclopropane-fatty-acyl-phospholipid synthase family protein [Myxococcaceae bacterium]|nr:cyclopropane-fatty-acyl-phospholipid synthase family protein [Myxococcaceae bacterium]
MDTRSVVLAVMSGKDRPFGVRLWDGTLVPPEATPEMPVLVISHERGAAAFGIPPSEERLAEAFLAGDLEVDGDLVDFLQRASTWSGPEALPPAALAAGLVAEVGARAGELLRSAARHTLARDEGAIKHHYDVGNDFYRLFLDEQLVYSCAYWTAGAERLELAQVAKLELICRKLGLKPGERFLDLGCGWGALIAHAAKNHGAHPTGISLSDVQLEVARERMRSVLPPEAIPDVRHQDYRELPPDERWDAVASVGMMEHVGREELDRYFSAIARHLVPGGLLLNHAIADNGDGRRTIPWLQRTHGGFIQQEIFPDSDLPPLDLVVAAAQRSGFEVLDVETLRPHYERTLLEWLGRLERRFPEAVQLAGKRRARAWRLYLASCVVTFRTGRITVAQVLLRKRDGAEVPIIDRLSWYRDLAPRS